MQFRNVHSFCNTHWVLGTAKHETTDDLNKIEKGNKVGVDPLTQDEDIDHEYDRVLKILTKPRSDKTSKRSASERLADYYIGFSKRFALAWIVSNFSLIFGILHSSPRIQSISISYAESKMSMYLAVSISPQKLILP